jgi:DNA-binding transcriptional MerR regulator/methylmalonyl-CoA mutase cobalamin-binding subunit
MLAIASIHTAATRTGLSAHTIRAWETRHQAIAPSRSSGRHRVYSEADIRRLSLLADVSNLGHGIGKIAKLSNIKLLEILSASPVSVLEPGAQTAYLQSQKKKATGSRSVRKPRDIPYEIGEPFRQKCLEAVADFDTRRLESELQDAQVTLGDFGLLRFVVGPLAEQIGEQWRQGVLTAAQEHFFTNVAKIFIWNLTRQYHTDDSAPRIVVGTPNGQLHDMGALMVAACAANLGWRVAFVGPNLPAHELAGAVMRFNAQCLALSLTYPGDDPKLSDELLKLRHMLSADVHILVGGRASSGYRKALSLIGARLSTSLDSLFADLDSMRVPRQNPPATKIPEELGARA